MKIRSGFVSNSSSSSFTIVMTPEQEKEWRDNLDVYEKQVIDNSYLGRKEEKIGDFDVVIFSGMTGNWCFYEDFSVTLLPEDEDLSEEEFEEKYGYDNVDGIWPGELWYSAKDKLPKNVAEVEVDC